YLLQRLLIDAGGAAEQLYGNHYGAELMTEVAEARQRLAKADCPVPQVESRTRYHWLRQRVRDAIVKVDKTSPNWTGRLDRILTHKIWGLLIFLAMMFIIFQSIFWWAKWPMDLMKQGVDLCGQELAGLMSPGLLRSFLVDGVIAGVGGV